ncbi:hypothetical protein A7A08_00483 [Methyloligella halotolerans]|uniref:Uncharacterized protein n=1 Tax=Methyloligella halotolerans TaxID=1177755 RepID=A0A1E2S2I9_9HYPH|nr:hypothetical protein [Methyloligella halotolerans]ODA68651.1 hypothetical protein A7A08_00483 [Methyloligella halotolerans]
MMAETKSEGESQRDLRLTYSDALLIALAPAVAYYYSYYFERGILRSHNMPTDLVEVGVGTVLVAIATGGALLWAIATCYCLFLAFLPRAVLLFMAMLRLVAVSFLAWLLAWWYLGWSWITIALSLLIFFVIAVTVSRLLIRRHGSFLDRLEADVKADSEAIRRNFSPLISIVGIRYWNLFLTIVLLLPIAFFFTGQVYGRMQRHFPVFQTEEGEWAIVRNYGNRWVVRRTDNGRFAEEFASMPAKGVPLRVREIKD